MSRPGVSPEEMMSVAKGIAKGEGIQGKTLCHTFVDAEGLTLRD